MIRCLGAEFPAAKDLCNKHEIICNMRLLIYTFTFRSRHICAFCIIFILFSQDKYIIDMYSSS